MSAEPDTAAIHTKSNSRLQGLRDFLGLERNIVAASSAVFLLGMGEELWKKFLPKYLESLGASVHQGNSI